MTTPKTLDSAQLAELAKKILELQRTLPNNYDLGTSVRRLTEMAISNPSVLINNQKDAAQDEQD